MAKIIFNRETPAELYVLRKMRCEVQVAGYKDRDMLQVVAGAISNQKSQIRNQKSKIRLDPPRLGRRPHLKYFLSQRVSTTGQL